MKVLRHADCIALARDPHLKTDLLLQQATDAARLDWESDDYIPNPALLILQQRTIPEVFSAACVLCDSPDPALRRLGVAILREFPGLDFPMPFARQAVPVLERLVERENDDVVLFYGVSALAYQKLPAARPILLRFLNHPDADIREVLAGCLPMTCPKGSPFPSDVRRAYDQLCCDPADGVRWYAYATLAEYLEEALLPSTQRAWADVHLQRGKKDPDPKVREATQFTLK